MMRISKAALAIVACLIASGARADWTAKDASGATITFKNSGTCSSVVCVVQQQPVDSTGAAFGVTGNPIFTSFGTGVTLPAFGSTPTFNLGTLNGAATAANQTTMIGVLGTVTTAHGCATAGYTVIGCLGQIDDDIKGAIPAGTNIIGKVGIDQTTPGTTNAVSIAQVGSSTLALGSTTASASIPVVIASNQTAADPCMFQAKTNVPISTASGTTAVVTGVSAKKIYVCSLNITAAAAVSVSLSEGSSSTCGTSAQAAVIGVATSGTAANGIALSANGGLTLGNGGGTIASTATNANYLCIFQSGTVQIAGNLTFVQQ